MKPTNEEIKQLLMAAKASPKYTITVLNRRGEVVDETIAKQQIKKHAKKRVVIPKKIRNEVLLRDGLTCHYCGFKTRPGKHRHIDHIDGDRTNSNDVNNLVMSCHTCNGKKGNKPYLNFLNHELNKLKSHIKNLEMRLGNILK